MTIALFLVLAFGVKAAHQLLHDHHHGTEHTDNCGTNTHFHTLEYDFADCPICHFNFSPRENTTAPLVVFKAPTCKQVFKPYQVQPTVRLTYSLPALRAPPVATI